MPTLEEVTIGVVNVEKRVARLMDELATFQLDSAGHVSALEKRLKALEERLSDPPTWKTFEAALKRIEALEMRAEVLVGKLEEPEETRVFAVDREYDRQERWHDTYNAVRGGMEACTQAALNVDDAHEYAKEAADRAHGPLEGTVSPHPDINVAGVTVGEVTALVKAAAQAEAYLRDVLKPTSDVLLFLDGIRDALKPFATVKP